MQTPKQNSNSKNDIVNKGFLIIDNLFKENNWNIVINEPTWVAYTKHGHETEYFELKIEKSKVIVSIPLKKIPYQYNHSKRRINQLPSFSMEHSTVFSVQLKQKIN